MIKVAWLALRSSPTAIMALLALFGFFGMKANGLYREWQGIQKGEARMADKVEKKANADAKVADTARNRSATGASGHGDRWRLR